MQVANLIILHELWDNKPSSVSSLDIWTEMFLWA